MSTRSGNVSVWGLAAYGGLLLAAIAFFFVFRVSVID